MQELKNNVTRAITVDGAKIIYGRLDYKMDDP
jgi:hypothetical protein